MGNKKLIILLKFVIYYKINVKHLVASKTKSLKLANLPQIKIIDGHKNLRLEFFKDIKNSDKLKALSPTPLYGIGLQIQDFLPGAATRGVL